MSVWLGDLDGRPRYEHDALAPHYAASTMKLPLVIAAFRRVVRGELDLDTPVRVSGTFASVYDGSPFDLDESDDQDPRTWAARRRHPHARRARRAGHRPLEQHRDQPAARRRRPRRGRGGAPHRRLLAGDGRPDAASRTRPPALAGISNTVTAADLGLVMAAVGRREPALGGDQVLAPVEAMLARQVHVDQVPAGLPPGTPTASKSGWIPGVSHDVALVRPPGEEPFVLAVCTTVDLDETEAAAFVAGIARDVWRAEHPAGEEQP